MELIRDFKNLNKKDITIAGGKGASLGEMIQANIPVPPGFVVLSTAFERFLENTDLNVEIDAILHSVNHKEIHTIDDASEKIKALILRAEMPKNISEEIQKFFKKLDSKYVAVRSSATAEDSTTAAWAGQLESYLNTTEENLLENIKKCWASLFTPRAIFYRFEKGLHKQKISVAVVVQKMIDSEVSGVAFSVHPVTQDKNQLIIEASFGLGEAIVSGQITPDSYVVEKEPRRIIDKNVQIQTRGLYRSEKGGNEWYDIPKEQGEKQVLSDKEILELSDIIIYIENHYGFPVDIEWAKKRDKFYIVQSRPITTLTKIEEKIKKKEPLVFEKSITRDWGMLNSEIWHEIYTKEFKKQFGWRYTDVIFEGKDNTVTVFRAPKEHIDGMRDFIIQNLEKDKNWLAKQAKIVEKQVEVFAKEIEKLKKNGLDKYGLKELIKLLKDIFSKSIEVGPRFLIMLWFPIQMEKHERQKEFESAAKRAVESRAKIEKIVPMVDEISRLFANIVCKDINIPENLAKYVSYEEFISISEKDGISKEKLIERQKYFLISNNGIINENLEFYLKRKGFSLKKENLENVKEIKGSVAYPGIAKGKVKIITNKEMFGKLNSGEILVTTMTTPDFLPILKKSAAFITDEGGITCHAAIVSRELKIPCIIGTKIATQILKDGDFVEVNANNGIVRKIKDSK